MNLNYTIEGEPKVITIITDRLPVADERVKLPDTVLKRHWPHHIPSGFTTYYFRVVSVVPLDEDNFNIELAR